MKEYRATIRLSPEQDLSARTADAEPMPTERVKPTFRWRPALLSVGVCVLVLAIVLPIALVFGPSKSNNTITNNLFYTDEEDVQMNTIGSIAEFNAKNHTNLIVSDIGQHSQLFERRLRANDEVIGLFGDYGIYADNYISFYLYVYTGQYRMETQWFKDYTDEIIIRDVTVKYKVDDEEDYRYIFEFERDGYLYQGAMTCYETDDIAQIIADCFDLKA